MKYNFEVLPYLIKELRIIYVDLLNWKEKYPLACIGWYGHILDRDY